MVAVGGNVGLAPGPFAPVTVPAGTTTGAIKGAIAGAITGVIHGTWWWTDRNKSFGNVKVTDADRENGV